jgi:non-heme chloroperoxidase
MSNPIVMIHGANCGGWCFDLFRDVFEARGLSCYAPDLIGHGAEKETGRGTLANVGIADYREQMAAFVKALPERPILLGHSMGAVIAQQLAAQGFAEKLVLVSPGPRAGILPPTDAEKQLCQDLMTIGDFWTRAIDPNFDLACFYTLNLLPKEEQRRVFDKLGPESGRALFELFFWMFDRTRATAVETPDVTCPVLCLSGAADNIVSLQTAKATAEGYGQAEFWALDAHAHMLVLEPGAEGIAERIADWIA